MITTEWLFGDVGLEDAHAIRRAVFITEMGIDESIEMDGTDFACIHLVAYDEGIPAATGRIQITEDDFRIGRVAVMPAFRKHQYGTLVMQMLVHACYTMGSERQVVHAQQTARGFYEKLGFVAFGESYIEAGIPHINMVHEGDMTLLCHHHRHK